MGLLCAAAVSALRHMLWMGPLATSPSVYSSQSLAWLVRMTLNLHSFAFDMQLEFLEKPQYMGALTLRQP